MTLLLPLLVLAGPLLHLFSSVRGVRVRLVALAVADVPAKVKRREQSAVVEHELVEVSVLPLRGKCVVLLLAVGGALKRLLALRLFPVRPVTKQSLA